MASADWSERTKLLVTVAVALAANLGVWGFAYKVHGDWKIEEKKLQNVRKAANDLAAQNAKKPEFEAELTAKKREFETKEKKLPNDHHRDDFMEKLAEYAQQTNMDNLLPDPPQYSLPVTVPGIENPQNFTRDLWKLRSSGDFKSICIFLNTLEEKHKHFLNIENVQINTANSGMNFTGKKHDISFAIETYRYVPDKP